MSLSSDFYGVDETSGRSVRFRPERDINNHVRVRHFKHPDERKTKTYVTWTCTVLGLHQDSLIMAIDSSATRTDVAEIFGFTRLIFENKGEKHANKN